ncbi:hypothetical protein EX30DRAFT_344043 [Ascodesmis nigricans]|uniref:Uncharacterized protein n=1 Tax=Ascodesmis nigricans TaxID=341454 RepID=A0A4S2MRC7_9PEZI|nr:hypothetical protein EX30DRAFT_344043 [Ascodesmis nigricans]
MLQSAIVCLCSTVRSSIRPRHGPLKRNAAIPRAPITSTTGIWDSQIRSFSGLSKLSAKVGGGSDGGQQTGSGSAVLLLGQLHVG